MNRNMVLEDIKIQNSWKKLDLNMLSGIVMIIGGPNTGKTTFANYLYSELSKLGRKVSYLDGDPGQSTFGPPTTMTLKMGFNQNGENNRELWRSFVGSTSPKGHMLQTVVGAKRLSDVAKSKEGGIIIYDTTGLISPSQGGLALKLAKIDLLRPSWVIALQKKYELSQLLIPLKEKQKIRVEELHASNNVRIRDQDERKRYRMRKFRNYFTGMTEIEIDWTNIAVFPAPRFVINRLVALENIQGFISALGIIISIDPSHRILKINVPETSLGVVDSIRLGDILLNPDTFEERFL